MASHQFLQKNRRQGGYTIVELGIALTIVAVQRVANDLFGRWEQAPLHAQHKMVVVKLNA